MFSSGSSLVPSDASKARGRRPPGRTASAVRARPGRSRRADLATRATLATRADPTTLSWITLSSIAAALILVVTNVVGPRARPHLTRIADTISVLSLFVLIPLAVYLWG